MPSLSFTFNDNFYDVKNVPTKEDITQMLINYCYQSFSSESFSSDDVSIMSNLSSRLETIDYVNSLAVFEYEEETLDNRLNCDNIFSSNCFDDLNNEFISHLVTYSTESIVPIISASRYDITYGTNENDSENDDTSNNSHSDDSSTENHFENGRENVYSGGENTHSDFNYIDEINCPFTPLPSDSEHSDDSKDNSPPQSPTNGKNHIEVGTVKSSKSTDVKSKEESENTDLEDKLNIPLPKTFKNDNILEFVSPQGEKYCVIMNTVPPYGEINQCFKCKEYFDKNRLFKFVESGSKCKSAVSQGLICLRCSIDYDSNQLQDWYLYEENKYISGAKEQQNCSRCNKDVSLTRFGTLITKKSDNFLQQQQNVGDIKKTCCYCLLKQKRRYIIKKTKIGKKEKRYKEYHEIDEDYEEYQPPKKVAKKNHKKNY